MTANGTIDLRSRSGGTKAQHPSSAAFAPNLYSSSSSSSSGGGGAGSSATANLNKLKACTAAAALHSKHKETNKKEARPSNVKVWIMASRPHTLTASIAPVLVGATLSAGYHYRTCTSSDDQYDSHDSGVLGLATLWAAFACLIQLGTNLHNDYADFVKGADDERRVGQARATQKGWLTPKQTAGGATLCLMVATVIGLILAHMAGTGTALSRGYARNNFHGFDKVSLFIIASSVFNAVAYTGGPYPLGYVGLGSISIGYSGLGDLFVFLYFGLVATLGVPYLYLRLQGNTSSVLLLLFDNELFQKAFFAAVPIGNLATAIIVVNNLRDRKTDVEANKRTMAVRFGERFVRIEYALLVLSSYACLFALAKTYEDANILPLLSLPVAMPQLEAVAFGGKDGGALNEHVGGTARVQLLFCLLMVLGLQLSE